MSVHVVEHKSLPYFFLFFFLTFYYSVINLTFFFSRWFLSALKSAMVKGCREPPYPAVLTDATMEKLALTKFISQESHCEVDTCSTRRPAPQLAPSPGDVDGTC